MTEHTATRVVYCDRCDRAIVGGRYFVDCSGPRTVRLCRGCAADPRKLPTASEP